METAAGPSAVSLAETWRAVPEVICMSFLAPMAAKRRRKMCASLRLCPKPRVHGVMARDEGVGTALAGRWMAVTRGRCYGSYVVYYGRSICNRQDLRHLCWACHLVGTAL